MAWECQNASGRRVGGVSESELGGQSNDQTHFTWANAFMSMRFSSAFCEPDVGRESSGHQISYFI